MSKWPRQYLLTIYSAAITNGFCKVTNITAADAKSLVQTLYRLRRRADSSNQTFITPEHHLVTAMSWEKTHPDPDNPTQSLGEVVFVFDSTSAGLKLPPLEHPDEPIPPAPAPAEPESPAVASIFETEELTSSDLVQSLRRSAWNRENSNRDKTDG